MASARESLVPLWYRTAPSFEPPPAAPLGALDVDTIVVGAGIIGLSAALHLAERGARVAVLERDAPGAGSSGAANGQVLAGYQKDPDDVLAAYGPECGGRAIEFGGSAPDLVFELVARHGIECGAERNGWVQAARSRRGVAVLAKRTEAWARRGADVALLGRAETASALGTERYRGAWLDRRAGVVNALAYVRGLAAAAMRAGVQLACGVQVASLERRNDWWALATDRGDAVARTVVLATNVHTSRLEGPALGELGRSYLPAYSVQVATDPLDADVLATLLPGRRCASDASHLHLRYFRLDPEGRFVMGGPGWLRAPRSSDAPVFRRLERSTRRMFPQLDGIPFAHRWAARDAFTADLLPHLHEPAPGVFTAFGCNGRGIAIGTALGSLLARRVQGEPAAALPFPTTAPSEVPLNLKGAARLYLRRAVEGIRERVG